MDTFLTAGSGAARAARRAPAAVIAARRAAPDPICFHIFRPTLRIDDAAPNHMLLLQRTQRHQSLVNELLHALTAISLGGVDVALGVRHDAVHGIELPRLPATAAEPVQLLHRLAVENMDILVG